MPDYRMILISVSNCNFWSPQKLFFTRSCIFQSFLFIPWWITVRQLKPKGPYTFKKGPYTLGPYTFAPKGVIKWNDICCDRFTVCCDRFTKLRFAVKWPATNISEYETRVQKTKERSLPLTFWHDLVTYDCDVDINILFVLCDVGCDFPFILVHTLMNHCKSA